MLTPGHTLNRRDFLRASAGGGFALGGLLGLGMDLRAAQENAVIATQLGISLVALLLNFAA